MCCFDLPFRLTPDAARAALPHLEKAVGAPMTITSTSTVLAGRAEGWQAAVAAMQGRPSARAVPLTIMGMVVGALVTHGQVPRYDHVVSGVRIQAAHEPTPQRERAADGFGLPGPVVVEHGTTPRSEAARDGALDSSGGPIDACDLRKAARHLSDQLELDHLRRKAAMESIPVELGGRTRFIDPGAVWYAEAHGDYVRLRTAEGGYLVRTSMAALEQRWAGAGFIRAHRSTLVNARHVSELRFADGRALLLVGTETLPVSRRHTRQVRERLTARRA
ncbi:LytR/AlgR family response regulator transcription factor [Herbidospora sp. RD11066]